jgi:hypothetical protein
MRTLLFRELPLFVQITVGVVYLSAWVLIEEFVIDRYGLWKYMPYYRVADPCVWDLAVALIISVAIWWASRRTGTHVA